MWSRLPEEIMVMILSMLPVKSVLRFKCVCKTWYKLSHDSTFVKLHLNHAIQQNNFSLLLDNAKKIYSVEYDSSSSTYGEAVEMVYPFKLPEGGVGIWGSCNGLCCLKTDDDDSICLWNPSTGEFKNIPSPPNKFPGGLRTRDAIRTYGFGYDSKMDDYMLLRIMSFTGSYNGVVNVYTLGSNSWKSIQNIHHGISFGGVVLLNGAIHWMAVPCIGPVKSKVIASLDIVDERFGEVPQPEHLDAKIQLINVGQLEGCLRIIGYHCGIGTEVWVMKDYGVKESWTKMFTINHQKISGSVNYLKLIQSFKNGKLLLQRDAKALIIYDPTRQKAKTLKIRGTPCQFSTLTYLGSLVSLNSGSSSRQEHAYEAIEQRKELKERHKKRKL